MAPLSKRKLAKETDEGSNSNVSRDTLGGVLRPSKRLNTTLPNPSVVHARDRVAYDQFPFDENAPWVQGNNKKFDQSNTLKAPSPFRKTPFGAVLGEAAISKIKNPRSIADDTPQTSVGTVSGNAALSFLDDVHSEAGTVVSFITPPTTKAGLDNIPEELVVDIFNLLRGDSASLYNISLVNRHCRRIALEPLYSTFNSDDILHDAGTYVSAGRAFVRSIVNDGDLAEKVKSLTWAYNVNTVVRRGLRKYRPDKKERIAFRLYVNQLRLLGHEAASMWADKLYNAHREVNQLAIALLRSPNLRELVVYDDSTFPKYSDYDLEWMQVLTHAACGFSPKFEQLRSISISVRGAHFRFWAISDILQLPSLRKFSLSGAVESGPLNASLWFCPDSASGVEDLVLSQCFFDSRVVDKFLSSCKAIKKFEYSYDSAHWEPLSFGNINANTWAQHSWTIIRAGLEKHRDTLEVLKLEDNSDPEIVDIMHLFVVDEGCLGSLRGFPKLHEIQAPIIALISSDVATSFGVPYSPGSFASNLPRGVRTVKLIFDDAVRILTDYTMPVEALKNGRLDNTLPDLRQVCVYVKDYEVATLLQQELLEPVEALQNEGIDVKVLWGENVDPHD